MIRRRLVTLPILLLALFSAAATFAQQATPPAAASLQSPVVNHDSTLTFALWAPTAKGVELNIDAYPKQVPMVEDQHGVWRFTTKVLPPEVYGYAFVVDGVTILDPLNDDVRINNYAFLGSQVLLPAELSGAPPAPWEATDLPHGRIEEVRYTTHVAEHLPRNQTAYAVYTPPGYDAKKKGGYPVLYLLHGWSDDETAWDRVGHAGYILDELIALGKAAPMIVVMPRGYGDLDFVTHGFGIWRNVEAIDHNTELFEKMLLTEVMPSAEKSYNIAAGKENHAIAGLSMGGLESLTVGLHNTDRFAYVVGMSAAIHMRQFDRHFPGMLQADAGKKANLKLLWVGCGVGDDLLAPNREFVTWAEAKGLPVTPVETEGRHTWLVWRDNLVTVAPLLFRK